MKVKIDPIIYLMCKKFDVDTSNTLPDIEAYKKMQLKQQKQKYNSDFWKEKNAKQIKEQIFSRNKF